MPERIRTDEGYLTDLGVKLGEERLSEFIESLVMVEVVNSTAEPDGEFKNYWLRVPPDVGTAREAVAWTFNLSTEEYDLAVET